MMLQKMIAFALFLSLLILFSVSYSAGHPIQLYLLNSDALYLPTLFHNLFQEGGHISDWYLTPAPYFFPDYLLFGGAYVLASSMDAQVVIYALFQMMLTTIVFYFLFKTINKQAALSSAILMTTGLLFLALTVGKPFVYMLTSAFHFSTFIIELICITLIISTHQRSSSRQKRYQLTALCVFSFLMTLSDALFLVQFLLPLWIAFGLTQCIRREKLTANMSLVNLPFVFGVFGYFTYALIPNKTRCSSSVGISHLLNNLRDFTSICTEVYSSSPGLMFFFGIFYSLCLVFLMVAMVKHTRLNSHKTLLFLIVFSLVSLGSVFFASLLITSFSPMVRYFIPAMIWPLVVGIVGLMYGLGRRCNAVANALSLGLILILSYQTIELIKKNKLMLHHYPTDLACIDNALKERGLHHGIAGYWDAKYIQAFSHHPMTLAQHLDNLSEHRWITSKTFFRPVYDFAIISEHAPAGYALSTKKIEQMNGAAKKVIACGERTLLIYGHGQLQVRPIVHVGDYFQWRGCDLPTAVGHYTPDCEVTSSLSDGQTGYLSYGPYEPLLTGTYQFEMEYTSVQPQMTITGDWDIVTAQSGTPLAQGVLRGTDGHVKKMTGKFKIPMDYSLSPVEIRTKIHKGNRMTLRYLAIKRIK
jgi:hypothetical protein